MLLQLPKLLVKSDNLPFQKEEPELTTNVRKLQWRKENNKGISRIMIKNILLFFFFIASNYILFAQAEKNVDHQSLVWTRYYNLLELSKKWAIHSEFDNRRSRSWSGLFFGSDSKSGCGIDI